MYAPSQPSRREPDRSGDGAAAGTAWLPPPARITGLALLAAGVLAGIGLVLSITWAVDVAVVLAIATVATVLVRRSLRRDASSPDDQARRRRRRCC
ncbi:hypothetical protein ABZ628_21720 [Streptomyces diastaticus]|jgi:membrane protein implicated in regulation of membrane protease activity|nr:hypothetical protein [Streptomyces caniscabiei]GHE39373.1 hypothetical protein GCM10018771_19830 [Streptomyces cellulosae]